MAQSIAIDLAEIAHRIESDGLTDTEKRDVLHLCRFITHTSRSQALRLEGDIQGALSEGRHAQSEYVKLSPGVAW